MHEAIYVAKQFNVWSVYWGITLFQVEYLTGTYHTMLVLICLRIIVPILTMHLIITQWLPLILPRIGIYNIIII